MRYLRIYKQILSLNMTALMIYRANFYNSLVASFIWGSFHIINMLILSNATKSIYGWSRSELLLLTATYSISFGLFSMLFSRNFSRLSILIDNGSLDGLLIKPLDSQFLVSVGQVNYTALVRSVLGIILLAYLVNTIHFSFNFLQIFIYILLILCGIVLTYCIWLMVSTLLIWLPRLSNLIDLLHFLSGTGRYPAEMFSQYRVLSVLFFPLTIAITIPAKSLLQRAFVGDYVWLIVVTGLFFMLTRAFWLFALRSYTSANS